MAGLVDLIRTLAPLILQLLDAYKEGKLEQIKEDLKAAKTPEEKLAVARAIAERMYERP